MVGNLSDLLVVVPADEILNELGDRQILGRLAVATGVGMLVGFQRQFAKQGEGDDMFAGARSFALVGLSGGLGALLADRFARLVSPHV